MAKNTRDASTSEHTIAESGVDFGKMTPAQIKEHYKELADKEIAKHAETRRELIKEYREQIDGLLEGTGVTLREVFMLSSGEGKPGKKGLGGYYKLPSGEEVKYNGFGIRPKKLQDQDLSTLPKRDL